MNLMQLPDEKKNKEIQVDQEVEAVEPRNTQIPLGFAGVPVT